MTDGMKGVLRVLKEPTPGRDGARGRGGRDGLDLDHHGGVEPAGDRGVDRRRRHRAIAGELGARPSGSWRYSIWRWISDARRRQAGQRQIAPASRRVTARSIARSSMPRRHSSSRIARTRSGSAAAQIDRHVHLAAEPTVAGPCRHPLRELRVVDQAAPDRTGATPSTPR